MEENTLFNVENYSGSKQKDYELVIKQLRALLEGESNTIANLANASALLNQFLNEVNWVGFYLMEDGELVLGPFQGLPACVRIPLGKGVCGTAAQNQKTERIEDVHAFPGHIACDSRTNSEIVVPVFDANGKLAAVLDVDSEQPDAFDEIDLLGLEAICRILLTA